LISTAESDGFSQASLATNREAELLRYALYNYFRKRSNLKGANRGLTVTVNGRFVSLTRNQVDIQLQLVTGSHMATPAPRPFQCPLTESACIDRRCSKTQCFQRKDDEDKARKIQAREQEIQLQQLKSRKWRKAASQVAEARVNWLNSQDTCVTNDGRIVYYWSAKWERSDEVIERILTSPQHRGLVRAAVGGLSISEGPFAKDEDLDALFEGYEQIDEL
jgi:hypothetical protein